MTWIKCTRSANLNGCELCGFYKGNRVADSCGSVDLFQQGKSLDDHQEMKRLVFSFLLVFVLNILTIQRRGRGNEYNPDRITVIESIKQREDRFMTDENYLLDKSTWATGGGVLVGLGVGFFFLSQSVFYFVGSLLAGLGLGLMVTAILSSLKR